MVGPREQAGWPRARQGGLSSHQHVVHTSEGGPEPCGRVRQRAQHPRGSDAAIHTDDQVAIHSAAAVRCLPHGGLPHPRRHSPTDTRTLPPLKSLAKRVSLLRYRQSGGSRTVPMPPVRISGAVPPLPPPHSFPTACARGPQGGHTRPGRGALRGKLSGSTRGKRPCRSSPLCTGVRV